MGEKSVVFCCENLEHLSLFLYVSAVDRPDLEKYAFEILMKVEWVDSSGRPPRVCLKIERGERPGELQMKLGKYEAVILETLRLIGSLAGDLLPDVGEQYQIPVRVESVSDLPMPSRADMYQIELTLDGKRIQSVNHHCGTSESIWLNLRLFGRE